MPLNPHPNKCPECGEQWDHLRMKCSKCDRREGLRPWYISAEKTPLELQHDSKTMDVNTGRITSVRTKFRTELNAAIEKAKDYELSNQQIKHLTGLAGRVVEYIMRGDDVKLSNADDFVCGMRNATRPLT